MRTSIQHSLTFARNSFSSFVSEQPFLFFIIGIIILRSIISQIIKSKLKQKYITPYENKGNTENKEFYLLYFKKVHSVNIFGVALIISLIFIYILTKDKFIGTVLAVGIWAILITFQTFTVSLLMYFILMKDYKVGDYIKIKNLNIQGEILYIKSLYVGIAGKNDYGENTWEFYLIPNNQIWQNVVTKVNLSTQTYSKGELNIPYDNEVFQDNFENTVKKIEKFLNDLLPLRAASQVWHFKSYIGVRYKLGFSYKDEKSRIRIWFIVRRSEEMPLLRQILSFIESLKQPKKEENSDQK